MKAVLSWISKPFKELQSPLFVPFPKAPMPTRESSKGFVKSCLKIPQYPHQRCRGLERCARLHPNWTVFSWTDSKARRLITGYYPWFLTPRGPAIANGIEREEAESASSDSNCAKWKVFFCGHHLAKVMESGLYFMGWYFLTTKGTPF
jgi:hypothetical protein